MIVHTSARIPVLPAATFTLLLDANGNDVSATPLTVDDLFKNRTLEKEFPPCRINTDEYMREVRRALFTNIFSEDSISVQRYNAFCRRYEREGGACNKECAQPKFDAWCLVRGTSRYVFKYKWFFARYPACYQQVKRLRKLIDVNVVDNFL